MKTYGVTGRAPVFLTSALDESDRLASRSYHFTSAETAPGIQRTRDRVVPRAGEDVMEKRKNLLPCGDSNPDSSDVQSLYRLSYPGSLKGINNTILKCPIVKNCMLFCFIRVSVKCC
jgi:hypothetical protein